MHTSRQGHLLFLKGRSDDTTVPFTAKFVNGGSCTSAKLIVAFSWICTINREERHLCFVVATPNRPPSVSIYLVSLVVSAILHYKHDCTVWNSQVRSYPWYSHSHLDKLGSRPSSPPPRHHQAPISAPQPRRPIQLPARAVLSFIHKVEQMHVPAQDPGDPPPERRMSQRAIQHTNLASPRLTVLYPLHIQAVWGTSAADPSSGGGGGAPLSPDAAHSQMPLRSAPARSVTLPTDGGPPPLWNWPRADIMTLPPPPRKKAIPVRSASESASTVDPPRQTARGRERGGPARNPPASMSASPV